MQAERNCRSICLFNEVAELQISRYREIILEKRIPTIHPTCIPVYNLTGRHSKTFSEYE